MNTMSSQTRKYELKERAERQEATRRRIVEATVALHEEVGPARTTVAEIARRAGVQRLTVYNHFPELAATLAGSFRARGRRAERVAATVRLALDFWTWRRLKLEGLDDERAAALMADTVACQARPA